VRAPVDDLALLRRHGVQVTAQRLAVLRAVSERPHSTASDIGAVVQADIAAVSPQAVYDGRATLTDKAGIRRIQPAGSPARYEDRVGDHHHDPVRRACKRMVDVDCVVGQAPCLTVADDSGYQIDAAEVIIGARVLTASWWLLPCQEGDRVPYRGTRARRLVRRRRASARTERHQAGVVSE
jgi:Fe2+ or Zn2+ uptake regulation protein